MFGGGVLGDVMVMEWIGGIWKVCLGTNQADHGIRENR